MAPEEDPDPERKEQPSMIVFAQLSDTHLDGGRPRADRLRAVMASLAAGRAPLDAVLVSGDIADHGLPGEYEQARSLLSGPWPVLVCPGNHDERSAFRRVLLGGEGDHPINQVHRMPGAVIAACDSTIPENDDGYLTDDTLAWLDAELGLDPATPAFVVVHHQPVPLYTETSDVIRLSGEERLATTIERHPQVVAVLCGHAHSAAATTFAGRPLLAAPGVVSTSALPWEERASADLQAPPAVAYHALGDDGRLTTHFRSITPH
jgi:3',5'-cyclic AMP phosphodiesterase CpdA